MTFALPDLPYAYDALEPHISTRTLEFHHDKHHAGYVANLNKLIAGTELENLSLEEIVQSTAKDTSKTSIFNNAAQAWNHAFFWKSMKPNGGGEPSGEILKLGQKSFESSEDFMKKFVAAGTGRFGSGWVWLVSEEGVLKIETTSNADTPIAHGKKPLLCCDVWEHAYYLDYQNRRPDFLKAFLEHLANWDFAEENYQKAIG